MINSKWIVGKSSPLWGQTVKLRPQMAVCPHKGLDLPTTHLELVISKWCIPDFSLTLKKICFPLAVATLIELLKKKKKINHHPSESENGKARERGVGNFLFPGDAENAPCR